MCRARVATTDSFFAFDSRRARREACGVSPYLLAGILRGRCAFGRRTVLRSKLRIANEAAAQRRCGHRTAVRAAPHANAGWIGRSKIRLSKEPPARRRFRTPLRRNETAGAAGRGGNGHRRAQRGRRRGAGVRVRKYGAASVGAARGALFPTGTCSRFAPLLYAGGCGVKRKGRFCRARAGRHNNAYGKLWG